MTRITVPTPTRGGAPSHAPPDTRYAPGRRLARALGWFSIGLGLAEVLAPHWVADVTGSRRPALLRAYGWREITCGIGILSSAQPAGWMWARVAGDALDLATLGETLSEAEGERRRRALAATAAVAGVTMLDIVSSTQLSAAASLEG